MTDRFPRAMADLGIWAETNGVSVDEARRRFAQYGVLCGISSAPALRTGIVFKGGNALDFVWQPNRSTIDLDFSLDTEGATFEASARRIRELLGQGLQVASNRIGIRYAVHAVRPETPKPGHTFITYTANVGYVLPDEQTLLGRLAENRIQHSPHVLPVEISLNEPICDSTLVTIDPEYAPIRVSTVEDIVGEKLRALLQQPIRGRNRQQDLLDIAVIVRGKTILDRAKVAEFLQTKADARGVPVSKAAFRNPEVAERAKLDYAALAATTRTVFIPFDDALATVLAFVDELSIPDE